MPRVRQLFKGRRSVDFNGRGQDVKPHEVPRVVHNVWKAAVHNRSTVDQHRASFERGRCVSRRVAVSRGPSTHPSTPLECPVLRPWYHPNHSRINVVQRDKNIIVACCGQVVAMEDLAQRCRRLCFVRCSVVVVGGGGGGGGSVVVVVVAAI